MWPFKLTEKKSLDEVEKEINDILRETRRAQEAEWKAIGVKVVEYQKKYPVGAQVTILGWPMIVVHIRSNWPAEGIYIDAVTVCSDGSKAEHRFPIEVLEEEQVHEPANTDFDGRYFCTCGFTGTKEELTRTEPVVTESGAMYEVIASCPKCGIAAFKEYTQIKKEGK